MQIVALCSVKVPITVLSKGILNPNVWVFLFISEGFEGKNLGCPLKRSTSINVKLFFVRSFSILLVCDVLYNFDVKINIFTLKKNFEKGL
mgnify:CR=1 FL=1